MREVSNVREGRGIILILSFLTFYFLLLTLLSASGYPGDYLTMFGSNVRGLYLGGAYTAIADGSSSFYWNPAGLSKQIYREANLFYSPLVEGSLFQTFSFSFPLSFRNTIGISWVSLSIDGAEWVDDFGISNRGVFSDSRNAFFISYGGRMSKNFSWGTNVKIVNQYFHEWQSSSFGLDIGFLYGENKPFSYGLVIQNILAPQLKFAPNAIPDKFPINLRTGFKIDISRFFKISGDYILRDISPDKVVYTDGIKKDNPYFFGIEVNPFPSFYFGFGYNTREISAGVSLDLGNFNFGYNFADSSWGENHRVNIGIRFGVLPGFKEKILDKKEEELKIYEKYLKNKEEDIEIREERQEELKKLLIKERLNTAKRFLKKHLYSMAEKEVRTILRVDPENNEAQYILEGIRTGRLKADLKYAVAFQYYKNGEYKKSIKNLKKALKLNPEHTNARFLLNMNYARLFLKKGEYKEARKYAVEAFKILPENEEATGIIKGIDEIIKGKIGK